MKKTIRRKIKISVLIPRDKTKANFLIQKIFEMLNNHILNDQFEEFVDKNGDKYVLKLSEVDGKPNFIKGTLAILKDESLPGAYSLIEKKVRGLDIKDEEQPFRPVNFLLILYQGYGVGIVSEFYMRGPSITRLEQLFNEKFKENDLKVSHKYISDYPTVERLRNMSRIRKLSVLMSSYDETKDLELKDLPAFDAVEEELNSIRRKLEDVNIQFIISAKRRKGLERYFPRKMMRKFVEKIVDLRNKGGVRSAQLMGYTGTDDTRINLLADKSTIDVEVAVSPDNHRMVDEDQMTNELVKAYNKFKALITNALEGY